MTDPSYGSHGASTRRWWKLLVVLGAVLAVGPLAVSGVTAADQTTGDMPDLLVGVQGPADHGKVAAVTDSRVSVVSADAGSFHDVSPLPNDRRLETFVHGRQSDCGPYSAPCGRTGARIIAGNGTVLWQWTFPVRSVGNSELHDAEVLPNGDVLAVDMDRERVVIVDRENQTVSWQWNASQHYAAPPDPTRVDWLHMNDVDRIGPGRYLVSVRNTNQLVIINRSCTCLTEVVNENRRPSVIRGQHNPQWLGEGRVLVSDSSNDRVVELARRNGTWVPVWSVSGAGGVPFAWPRDADRLPSGNTLVTDSRNNRVVLVNPDGQLVASISTPALPYEADVLGGEPVGGPPMPAESVPPGRGEAQVPGLSKAYIGLQHAVPLPYWVGEWHLLTVVLGLLTAGVGLTYWPESRRERPTSQPGVTANE